MCLFYQKYCILYRILYKIQNLKILIQIVRVEPGITMGRLIPILIQSGWTIPVALDMKDLSIGKWSSIIMFIIIT